jgi:hypothetical protein
LGPARPSTSAPKAARRASPRRAPAMGIRRTFAARPGRHAPWTAPASTESRREFRLAGTRTRRSPRRFGSRLAGARSPRGGPPRAGAAGGRGISAATTSSAIPSALGSRWRACPLGRSWRSWGMRTSRRRCTTCTSGSPLWQPPSLPSTPVCPVNPVVTSTGLEWRMALSDPRRGLNFLPAPAPARPIRDHHVAARKPAASDVGRKGGTGRVRARR